MQITSDMSFEQILEIVKQLPADKRARLLAEISWPEKVTGLSNAEENTDEEQKM